MLGRRISDELIRKANAIVIVHLLMTMMLTMALVIAQNVDITDALYEVLSAICTVGVSRGLTPNLNLAGRIIIIIAMYLGRIGPISMALFFNTGGKCKNNYRSAKGRFIIG